MARQTRLIGVLMGGVSSEHDVSMESGSIMLGHLPANRYRGFPVLMTRDNLWMWPRDYRRGGYSQLTGPDLVRAMDKPSADWVSAPFPLFADFPRCDCLFIGLHGWGGEDGRIQGFLDLCGQAYTGSGCLGSAAAMDKLVTKRMFSADGIPTPRHVVLDGADAASLKRAAAELGYPLVVKLPSGGSSIGVEIFADEAAAAKWAGERRRYSGPYLAEEFIAGTEASCGYLENFGPLPATEIVPVQDAFFNYQAKYDPARTREVTPGNFTPELAARLVDLAARCHRSLCLSVYSRTDFRIREGSPTVLETNSLPGFTRTSLFPQAAKSAGLGYPELLHHIIEESLKK